MGGLYGTCTGRAQEEPYLHAPFPTYTMRGDVAAAHASSVSWASIVGGLWKGKGTRNPLNMRLPGYVTDHIFDCKVE